tara:strand:- start:2973 stop:3737 length:765 start_codon:yes stop_codon:yes gene_type:complete
MSKRHDSVGIKQVVRLEWYDYALEMLLDGLSSNEIRSELDNYISERLQTGGYGERGEQTYTKAVAQIMKCWVSPVRELVEFRDRALDYAKSGEKGTRLGLHWTVTTAAYPFWFRVAEQVGRLLNLQSSITQSQIRSRCFEAMGERSTIERSSRRVIRSFVAWNVLKDSGAKGCYERGEPDITLDQDLAILMLEAALHANPGGKAALNSLLNSPAFFPFQIPIMTGDFISRHSERIEVLRYGLDDELLKLKRAKP